MLLAIFLPGVSLLRRRRPKLGILFLVLQLTLVGWLVGAFVAVKNEKRQRTRRRMKIKK